MENNKLSDEAYLFEGLTEMHFTSKDLQVIRSLIETQNLYAAAIREIRTKLENLNDEFKYTKDRNPIHEIKSRVKSPRSIMKKLHKRGLEMSVESARKNLTDIAGVRVICPYIHDIYLIANLLSSQSDIELIRKSDYIENPKPNGYRSLHLIVTIPVFLSERTEMVSVEVQIRTIAMDFWASLEHELAYKFLNNKPEDVSEELKECADVIANTDTRMQQLFNRIHHDALEE
ncbi:GTP pyrophosphokinase [uncultured Sunxiuqinia sp.]|uniref:GTP pyrophosphokinase n=1 Tax=Sunxiuqinia rutila TaxID=1397841 RepID=UPI0026096751|nr:GTP pyrophosphokinase family protein [uncultured Sunxiuqinia sp.]